MGFPQRESRHRHFTSQAVRNGGSVRLLVSLVLLSCCHSNGAEAQTIRKSWTMKYCRFFNLTASDGTPMNYFRSQSYTYFGTQPMFRLPAPLDAIQPGASEYSFNGSCEYILDSACKVVVPGLSCNGCCYISPAPVTVRETCYTNYESMCDNKYSQFSGQCGTPPAKYMAAARCNICSL